MIWLLYQREVHPLIFPLERFASTLLIYLDFSIHHKTKKKKYDEAAEAFDFRSFQPSECV